MILVIKDWVEWNHQFLWSWTSFKCRLQLSQRSRGQIVISVVSLSVKSGQHSDDPAGGVRRSERDTCQVQLQRKEDGAIINNNNAENGAEQWEPTDSRELWITTAEPDTTNCSSFHTTELLLLDLTISDQNQGRMSGTHSCFIQNIIATFMVLLESNRTINKVCFCSFSRLSLCGVLVQTVTSHSSRQWCEAAISRRDLLAHLLGITNWVFLSPEIMKEIVVEDSFVGAGGLREFSR